ncbi:MAG: EF-hand domain-containing protein [Luteitalea sp.]
MSTVQAASATAVQDLAKSLMKTFDANSDGQLGHDEFGAFLSQLMGGIQTAGGTLAASTATTGPQTLTRGVQNRQLFEGFNFDREQNIEKSAKDAFASIAGASGTVPAAKAAAESWFNQHVKGGMEQLGHKVDWVKGDKFQFSNWQGSWVVDFVRGADGPNPAFTWLADAAGGPALT